MGIWRRDGKWGVDWREGGRGTRRHRVLVGSREEAQRVLADLTLKRRESEWSVLRRPPAVPIWDEVAVRFLKEHASQRRSPRTFESAVRVLRRYFGGKTLAEITGPAVRVFI